MIDQVKDHLEKVAQFESTDKEAIESFRIAYAGKKGILNDFFAAFREIPAEQKRSLGRCSTNLKLRLMTR